MNRDVAVVGCGYWGKNLVRTFAKLGRLHSVCDANEGTLRAVRQQYGVDVKTATNFDQILDTDTIKGVAIATPTPLHYSMTREAIIAGKDVFVEKPFTTSSIEAQELVTLAEDRQRVVMVGHLLLYHPCIRWLKAYIQSGEFGEIHYVHSTRVNLGQVRRGESALWRIGPHDISLLLYLLGHPVEVVSAEGLACLQPDLEDVIFATLNTGGILASVHLSWLDPRKVRQLTIVGRNKMVVFDDMEPTYKVKLYNDALDANTLVGNRANVYLPQLDSTEPLLIECQEFIHSMDNRITPVSDARLGADVVRILEQIEERVRANMKIGALN